MYIRVCVICFCLAISIINTCFGQKEKKAHFHSTTDTLALSLIKYLWKEDPCADKNLRKHVGFYIIENKIAFINKSEKEIKEIFGHPEVIAGYWDKNNSEMKEAVVFSYTAKGDICKPGEPIIDFDLWFVFKKNKLIDISGGYH